MEGEFAIFLKHLFFIIIFYFPWGRGGHIATRNLNEINSKSMIYILKHIFLQDCLQKYIHISRTILVFTYSVFIL